MVSLGGGAISYERGNPVIKKEMVPRGNESIGGGAEAEGRAERGFASRVMYNQV